jgi:hypothetical protein
MADEKLKVAIEQVKKVRIQERTKQTQLAYDADLAAYDKIIADTEKESVQEVK